jgi:hypothetical protein
MFFHKPYWWPIFLQYLICSVTIHTDNPFFCSIWYVLSQSILITHFSATFDRCSFTILTASHFSAVFDLCSVTIHTKNHFFFSIWQMVFHNPCWFPFFCSIWQMLYQSILMFCHNPCWFLFFCSVWQIFSHSPWWFLLLSYMYWTSWISALLRAYSVIGVGVGG